MRYLVAKKQDPLLMTLCKVYLLTKGKSIRVLKTRITGFMV